MTVLPVGLAATLEAAINKVLLLDPDTVQRLQELQGKVVMVQLSGLELSLYMIPVRNGLSVFSRYEGQADTILRGSPLDMARLGMAEHAGDMLFSGDVRISGDVELGQQFRDILKKIDIDWEEHLSSLVGDIVAHQAGKLVLRTRAWGRQTLDTLAMDAGEYLREESRDLPAEDEVQEFVHGVDILRGDTDRLDARLQRLKKKLDLHHASSNGVEK